MSYNFALIGASGYVAPKHMKAIKDVGGNLVAALDPHDSVGILDSYFPDCQFFTEFERFDRFCSKKVDNGERIHFVSICSPNHLHDAHCRFAMRIGADAICEKPLALKYRNLEELKIIEEKTGRKIYTILQLRLNGLQQNLKKDIQDGKITDEIITLKYYTPRGDWYDYTWKADPEKSGGLIFNIGVHLVDMLLWMFEGFSAKSEIIAVGKREVSGRFYFTKGSWNPTVSFVVSIEKQFKSKRELIIGNSCYELSKSFTDLHTASYKQILAENGFGINDAMPAVKMCEILRNSIAVFSLRPALSHELECNIQPLTCNHVFSDSFVCQKCGATRQEIYDTNKRICNEQNINHGPGSITCDRAGDINAEICRTCHGTGTCTYGKDIEP